jgi:hypothetical protein
MLIKPTIVEEPPQFELRNGRFYVVCPLTGVYREYPPDVYFETLARMARCAREYRWDETQTSADIIPFPARGRA